MKKWLAWLAMPVLASAWIFCNRSTESSLLKDSDTSVLMDAIRTRHDPWSWFAGDWPLGNHFYRPVSTLFFELDNSLYGRNAAGYGLTNVLLAIACVLLLFWLVREISESPWLAGTSSAVFGVWHVSSASLTWLNGLCWALATLSLLGLLRGGRSKVAMAFLCLVFLGSLWRPSEPFDWRIVGWLPGRTASVMTLFCLAAMATYSRFLRLTSAKGPRIPTSLDLPATRGTEVASPGQMPWVWLVVAAVSTALALGSYEQAVMLPGALTGLYFYHRLCGRESKAWPIGCFWGLLVAYVAVRFTFVPTQVSGYQDQQFRSGGGVLVSIFDYFLPSGNWARSLATTLSTGWILLVTGAPWVLLFLILGNIVSWKEALARPRQWYTLLFFALAGLSFLPMAWLQTFGHYHYWPSAMSAVYVVSLAAVAMRVFVIAISPPALQAPRRPCPAPGSLPRQ